MIWFACKQCGKKHSRAESSIGTLIFCDCGQANTVPWESTVEAPPVVETPEVAQPAPLPLTPRMEPVPVGEERVPPRRREPEPPEPERPEPERRSPRPGRRPPPRRRDPRFCLNHEETAMHKKCADCLDAFCTDCLVEFRGQTLCGPCKNFRARLLQRPPQVSGKALAAVLVGMLCLPLPLLLRLVVSDTDTTWLPLLALLPQLLALGLGVLALRETEINARVGGRSLAMTGVVTGAVTVVITFLLTFFSPSGLT
jgi:hypothetical protein